MNAALAFIEASPATCPLIVAISDRAGAGLATDGAVSACGEGVRWKLMLRDVGLDGLAGPRGQGVEFDDVLVAKNVEVVKLCNARRFPCLILLATQASDPHVERGEFFLERDDFAKRATEVRLVVPEFMTEFGGLFVYGLLGNERLDGEVEAGFNLGLECEGFGKEKAGIDRENRESESVAICCVHNHESSSLKAGADGGALAELPPSPRECVVQTGGFELIRFLADEVSVKQ